MMPKARVISTAAVLLILASPLLYLLFFRCGWTYYSERYDERRFNSLRVGMPVAELERIMGAPLEKVPQMDGSVLWTYSGRADYTCNFWRRWVYVESDKITGIVSDYWVE